MSDINQVKQQKEKELMALQQVLYSLDQLKEKTEIMVNEFESVNQGTEAVAQIMTNWNDVKRDFHTATSTIADYEKHMKEEMPLAEGAVRVGIVREEDKEGKSE